MYSEIFYKFIGLPSVWILASFRKPQISLTQNLQQENQRLHSAEVLAPSRFAENTRKEK